MSEEAAPARTKLDLLYREVLGEVSELMSRTEAVAQQLDATRQRIELVDAHLKRVQTEIAESAGAVGRLPSDLETQLEKASKHIATVAATATGDALAATGFELKTIAAQSSRYAAIAHASARRMALIALTVGAAAGAMGGILAGIALGQYVS